MLDYKVGVHVEAVNGARGVIVALVNEMLTVRYNGIGERNVPLARAAELLKEPAHKTGRTGCKNEKRSRVVLAEAHEGEVESLLSYLRCNPYRLYLSCKPELLGAAEDEYMTWTGGEELQRDAVRTYEKAYGREWFLVFTYSPHVQYPFPIIERGTGGGQGTPCGLHLNGRVEVCYHQIIEQLVRAGLRPDVHQSSEQVFNYGE